MTLLVSVSLPGGSFEARCSREFSEKFRKIDLTNEPFVLASITVIVLSLQLDADTDHEILEYLAWNSISLPALDISIYLPGYV